MRVRQCGRFVFVCGPGCGLARPSATDLGEGTGASGVPPGVWRACERGGGFRTPEYDADRGASPFSRRRRTRPWEINRCGAAARPRGSADEVASPAAVVVPAGVSRLYRRYRSTFWGGDCLRRARQMRVGS